MFDSVGLIGIKTDKVLAATDNTLMFNYPRMK